MLASLSIGDQAGVYQAVKLSRRSSSVREESTDETAINTNDPAEHESKPEKA